MDGMDSMDSIGRTGRADRAGGEAERERELEALAAAVEAAMAAEDLFGDLGATLDARQRALTTIFRRLAQVLHPDKYARAAAKGVAHGAFVKATALKGHAEAKIRAGTYGDRDAPVAPLVVTTRRRSYVVGPLVAHGDLCDLYDCRFDDDGRERRAVLKLATSPGDSDLVENEASVLRALYPARAREEKFYRYLPRLEETVVLRGDDGTERRANVLSAYPEHVSAAEILGAYPRGLDFRDVVWMYKRVLVALGFVHRQGFVHGAILPPHVLVHPTDHGARIVDWCYAARRGETVRALVKPYEAFYAPEIPARRAPSAATDIFMATKCAVALMGGDPRAGALGALPETVPKALARFLSTCLAPAEARRPDDAWEVHDDLDALLRRLVGERKYRPLAMPPRT
jgi:hypothetical protein